MAECKLSLGSLDIPGYEPPQDPALHDSSMPFLEIRQTLLFLLQLYNPLLCALQSFRRFPAAGLHLLLNLEQLFLPGREWRDSDQTTIFLPMIAG